MKKILIGCITLISLSCFADQFEVQVASDFAEVTSEVNKRVEGKELKRSIFKQIKKAKRDYRKIVSSDPDLRQKKRSLRKLRRALKKKGTPENNALRNVVRKCRERKDDCVSILDSTLSGIAISKNLVFHKRKTFSLMNSAYANGSGTLTCGDDHDDKITYHALLIGKTPTCGITIIGPGAYVGNDFHAMICTHSGSPGTNVGLGARAGAILSAGTGLTVGSNGVCVSVSVGLGIGAYAGIVLIDTESGLWR